MADPLSAIRDLTVEFDTDDGVVHAVTGVTYDVFPGETLGIVGESGSGKSVSTMSLLGLIPQPPGRVVSGEAIFDGRDLLKIKKSELRRIRGGAVSMVFQDPMTSLNPVFKVGDQICEALVAHGHEREERRRASDRAAPDRRHPEPRAAGEPVPARVLGRDAAARDDRDGDRERARSS